ncbi:HutD/Ves family protein [Arthrobacter burdickii]|uniref:HutD family protein n=1 Tax=Arthrobacter burdickii TaxID=3035920 RepID=A0ABT8JZZ8_9MICC|nr:HutD family protein [Arthrobacter burdickii]MDN4609917.1 HutD family protein [Arthrobacter burdickii]
MHGTPQRKVSPHARIIDPLLLEGSPWANGGGVTHEVLKAPPGAGYSDFDWRLSIADIVHDGAFSSLPGVDRTFVMGSEGLLRMAVDGESRDLELGALAAFPGEADVRVEVLEGPTRNLNLMTRRTVCEGSIDVQRVSGPLRLGGTHSPAAVVVLSGTVRLGGDGALQPLQVLVPGSDEEEVSCEDALLAAVHVRIRPQT